MGETEVELILKLKQVLINAKEELFRHRKEVSGCWGFGMTLEDIIYAINDIKHWEKANQLEERV